MDSNSRFDLGSGDDIARGFVGVNGTNQERIEGGLGVDKSLLAAGTYLVTDLGQGYSIAKGSNSMTLLSFEKIGSAQSGNVVDLMAGTLTIGVDGSVSLV